MFGSLKRVEISGSLNRALDQVREFHVVVMGQPVAPQLGIPPHDRVKLRASLIAEEALETIGAMLNGGRKQQTKELIARFKDLIAGAPDPERDSFAVLDSIGHQLACQQDRDVLVNRGFPCGDRRPDLAAGLGRCGRSRGQPDAARLQFGRAARHHRVHQIR